MLIKQGEEFLSSENASAIDISDTKLALYIKSLASEAPPKGHVIEGEKERFEDMLKAACLYQEVNGGYLEARTDDVEGFFRYISPFIVHHAGDGEQGEFWGKTLSSYPEYSIAAAGPMVEFCIHKLFVSV